MENSEQNLPAPSIKEEYAEEETVSRQIKKEKPFALDPRVDVQNKIGSSRVIKNRGQAITTASNVLFRF